MRRLISQVSSHCKLTFQNSIDTTIDWYIISKKRVDSFNRQQHICYSQLQHTALPADYCKLLYGND